MERGRERPPKARYRSDLSAAGGDTAAVYSEMDFAGASDLRRSEHAQANQVLYKIQGVLCDKRQVRRDLRSKRDFAH